MNKEQIALKAIIKSSGTPWGEEGIDKFYAHHIKELFSVTFDDKDKVIEIVMED